MAVLTALVLLLAVPVLVLTVITVRTQPQPVDLAWLTGNPRPPADEVLVATRYLRRHRLHRAVGGLLGVAVAVVLGMRWNGTVAVGIGELNPLADPLFLGLAGVVVGALVAESFRLPRTGGPARASLEPRARVPGGDHVRLARALSAVLVGVTAVVVLRGGGTAGDLAGPVTTLALGLAVVGLAELTRARVVDRRRPALSPRAARLDGRLREFAASSVAHLETAAAVLALAWVLSAVDLGASGGGPWELVQVVLVLVGLAAAVHQLLAARPRPPRGWRTDLVGT